MKQICRISVRIFLFFAEPYCTVWVYLLVYLLTSSWLLGFLPSAGSVMNNSAMSICMYVFVGVASFQRGMYQPHPQSWEMRKLEEAQGIKRKGYHVQALFTAQKPLSTPLSLPSPAQPVALNKRSGASRGK